MRAREGLVHLDAEAGASDGRMKPSSTRIAPRMRASWNGVSIVSAIRQLGIAGAKLEVRGPLDGPCVKVRRDLGVVSLGQSRDLAPLHRPPARPRAGWRIEAPAARACANSRLVVRRSPVATGVRTARATRASDSMSSGGTGSSYQRGEKGSMAAPMRIAPPVENCPWVPKRRSARSPTAPRMARQKATDLARSGMGGMWPERIV
jgi:hypothetical protein